MTVIVNEKKITLKEREDAPVTVTDLLKEMNVPEKGTAVAVNNRMVRRDDWTGHKLVDGDKVLLIKAAYGG